MDSATKSGVRWRFILALAILAFLPSPVRAAESAVTLHALLIGGGPSRDANTAEIENHMRFVAQTLPASASRIALFADGNPSSATVAYTDPAALSEAQRALDILLPKSNFGAPMRSRAPNLRVKLDGPANREQIRRAFTKLATSVSRTPAPVLVYVAGHGSHNTEDEENNSYNLWKHGELSVHDLAAELSRLPAKAPVALVMAQCYSGAFGNVIFRNGDPAGEPASCNIAGFFATAKDREAAGCGSDVSAPDYQDFSSYFFGALSGRNRLGEPVRDADYDGDGRVSMHEAYCYALILDESVDTPTCTSDVFLRRFVPMTDREIYETPFERIRRAATPAQRAALDALSQRLGLEGEKRLLSAYDRLNFSDPVARQSQLNARNAAQERLNELREKLTDLLFARWPSLRWSDSKNAAKDSAAALRQLESDEAGCHELIQCKAAYDHAEDSIENEEAFLLRFTRLCESIVRAEQLRESGDARLKSRFDKVFQAEQQCLPIPRAE